MTNTRIETVIATAQNLAVDHKSRGKRLSELCVDSKEYIGPDSSFEQRAAFDWALLELSFKELGDQDTASYC